MTGDEVDILMATYNGGRYIAQQLATVQKQSLSGWRLLVSDDCSSDDTTDIVHEYAASDPNIVIVGEGVRRGGAKENFAYLMGCSSAPYVAFSDQDDVWLPNKLERLVGAMHELETRAGAAMPLLIFSDAKVVDENLNIISESFAKFSRLDPRRHSFAQLLAQNVAPGFLMLANRTLIELATPTILAPEVSMHDWWLMLCAASFGLIGYVNEPLALYRQHGDNAIGAQAFSMSERVSHMSRMDERFAKTLLQATAFRDSYAGRLCDRDLATVTEYVAIVEGHPLGNVAHLFHSRCWKSGTRKMGQILSAIRRGMRHDSDLWDCEGR